jgi:hypothetical protein
LVKILGYMTKVSSSLQLKLTLSKTWVSFGFPIVLSSLNQYYLLMLVVELSTLAIASGQAPQTLGPLVPSN